MAATEDPLAATADYENEEGLDDPIARDRAILDEGELVPPVDDITAGGLEFWEGQPPLYHDLNTASYTKFDVQEWAGKLRKYKAEVGRYAERCRVLEREVQDLTGKLQEETSAFGDIEEQITEARRNQETISRSLDNEVARRKQLVGEVNYLKRLKENLEKSKDLVQRETATVRDRIASLQSEVEKNREKHERALGEKEKLYLERKWFFRERLLLEETTEQEVSDISAMKEKLDKLRHSMHDAWREVKRLDLLGRVRATKRGPNTEEWYAARRRLFGPGRGVSIESAEMGSAEGSMLRSQ